MSADKNAVIGKGSGRRILFLTPQLPYPPEQGAAIRNYHLITQVAKRHDIGLLSFAQHPSDDLGPLEQACSPLRVIPVPRRTMAQRLCTLMLSRDPDMAHRLRSSAYAEALHELLTTHPFDIVQVEGIELAPYALLVRRWFGSKAPAILLDEHNAEYILQQRAFEADVRQPRRWHGAFYSWMQWHRLMRFERHVCQQADGVIAVSETDARALRALSSEINPLVLPNGVDVQRYHPALGDTLPLKHPAVVFTGRMDFRPNVDAMGWFYHHIWPQVRARVPDAHLYIVGKAPHPSVQALAADPSITVTGYVTDILPYFGGADIFVVPLRMGGGTRLKVLEAMAAGLPLVSTTIGAEGIVGRSGEYLLLADTAEAFAEAVVDLLRNEAPRRALGMRAREYVLQHYDWQNLVPRLEELYASLPRRA